MTIQYTDAAAIELRDWLNENHTAYATHAVTDAQLGVWLAEAEDSEGLVEIRGRDSVSGNPVTFRIAL